MRLNGYIQGGERLIGHNKLRMGRQSSCNSYPLALPTTELVGISIQMFRLKAHFFQQVENLVSDLTATDPLMRLERTGDDLVDGFSGIEGGKRILENDLKFFPERSQVLRPHVKDFSPIEEKFPCRRFNKTDQRPAESGLPAAAFTHQPEGFPSTNLETDVIDGVNIALLFDEIADHPSPDPKIGLQMPTFNKQVFRWVFNRRFSYHDLSFVLHTPFVPLPYAGCGGVYSFLAFEHGDFI